MNAANRPDAMCTRLEALARLLDQIAISCDTLANFSAINAESSCERSTYSMHAVQAMAERIGAMASLALDVPHLNAARHLVGYDLAEALVGPVINRQSAAMDTMAAPPMRAAAAPAGVDLAKQLLQELRSIDDADVDETERNRQGAERLQVAIDASRSGGCWPDFAKAISYLVRLSVGGCTLSDRDDLSKKVQGLDTPSSADRAESARSAHEGVEA